MIDQRKKLEEKPFSYQLDKNEKIRIFYNNKHIMTLSPKDSKKLMHKISDKDDFQIQLALAKVTGNFKRGNENKSINR